MSIRVERLKFTVQWLASEKSITMTEIGKLLGYNNQSYFSQILNGHKTPATDLPKRLAALDPRINIDYLLGTSDEPLVSGDSLFPVSAAPDPAPAAPSPKKELRDGVFIPTELVQMFSDMAATIRLQQQTIMSQQETLAGGLKKSAGDAV